MISFTLTLTGRDIGKKLAASAEDAAGALVALDECAPLGFGTMIAAHLRRGDATIIAGTLRQMADEIEGKEA